MKDMQYEKTIRLCCAADGEYVRYCGSDYEVLRTFDSIVLCFLYKTAKGSILGSKRYILTYGLRCQMWVDVVKYVPEAPKEIITDARSSEEIAAPLVRHKGKYDNRGHNKLIEEYS